MQLMRVTAPGTIAMQHVITAFDRQTVFGIGKDAAYVHPTGESWSGSCGHN
jgi:hypothetical protein